MNSLVYLLLFVLLNIVNGNVICSDADDEDFCEDLREERNMNCFWNTTTDVCQRVSCGQILTEEQCESAPWSTEFYCQWDVFEDTALGKQINPPSGDLELCFTQCPLNMDIVFIVDISQSVVTTDDKNAEIFGDFVGAVMDTWWKMNEQLSLKTAFGMVSFATEVDTQFDLNTDWELEEYLDFVDDFFVEDNFGGQTNTLGAFWESLDVFDGSEHYNDTHWTRMSILVTDGDPTIAPQSALFGPNPCEPEYDINGSYAERGIFLYAALVAPATTVFLDCFHADRSLIREVGNFSGLGAEIGRIVGQLRCPVQTEEPTENPTEMPTMNPTDNPTEIPTEMPTEVPTEVPSENPTADPTQMPSEQPTEDPTNNPTDNPTNNPTDNPTAVPTEMPTEMPTEIPSENPTNDPTSDPSQNPTEDPSQNPTEEPSHRAWWTPRPTQPRRWNDNGPPVYSYNYHGFDNQFGHYAPEESVRTYKKNNYKKKNHKKHDKKKKDKDKDCDKKNKKKKNKKKDNKKKKNKKNSKHKKNNKGNKKKNNGYNKY